MGSLIEQPTIDDEKEAYEDKVNESIEQSAIYANVEFACLKKKCLAVVLTPICDIATKRCPYLTLAPIIPAQIIYDTFLLKNQITDEQILGVISVTAKQFKSLKEDFIDQYIRNNVYRYHFMPRLEKIFDSSFVDFQVVQTFSVDEFKYSKIALLKSPWREAVPSRYAAYCLRIGTPNYSDTLLESFYQGISHLKK